MLSPRDYCSFTNVIKFCVKIPSLSSLVHKIVIIIIIIINNDKLMIIIITITIVIFVIIKNRLPL